MNKAKDLFVQPTAREKYERDLKKDPAALAEWKVAFERAVFDSIAVPLPYSEAGKFTASSPLVYTYNFDLNPGERLVIDVQTDSLMPLIFLDLYKK